MDKDTFKNKTDTQEPKISSAFGNNKEYRGDQFSDVEQDTSFIVHLNVNNNENDTHINFHIQVQNLEEPGLNTHTATGKKFYKDESQNINEEEQSKKVSVEAEIQFDHDSAKSDAEEDAQDSNIVEQNTNENKVIKVPKIDQSANIYEYYKELRKQFTENGILFEDEEFPADPKLFSKIGELSEEFKDKYTIEFERPTFDDDNFQFVHTDNTSSNIDYEFKLRKGIIHDKFFIGAVLLLFRRREQFFTNLILDYENIYQNLRAGFCGFTFFINGEWKNVTIDTRLPYHQTNELALTSTLSTKCSFWISLFEKAYAKLFKTYEVLSGSLIKDYLVDLTGGWSKLISIHREKLEEAEKKFYFNEIKRCLSQGYLIGCMKYDESQIKENLEDSQSDMEQNEDEQIVINSMYTVSDIQELFDNKIIYLTNSWNRGKWTNEFGVDDDTIWEANKAYCEKLGYQVSHTDGTFWMRFEDWLVNFNSLYYCRIFTDTWSQYCIPGAWTNVTSGGAPPKNPDDPWIPERLAHPVDKGSNFASVKSINIPKPSVEKPPGTGSISPTNKRKTNVNIDGAITKGNLAAVVEGKEYNNKEEQLNGKKESNKNIHAAIKQTTSGQTSPMIGANLNKTNVSISSSLKNTQMLPSPNAKANLIKCPSDDIKCKSEIKRVVISDSEDRWFMNPQYKIETKPGTKIIISLLQEDKKLQNNAYIKCNFMIIFCRGKYSRVWDLNRDYLIKKAIEDDQDVRTREIIVHLDYNEIVRKINKKITKKKIVKGDNLQFNLIPYIEYYNKYEVEKKGNFRSFKPYAQEALYWLKIFSSDDIMITELKRPFEYSISSMWVKDFSAGGSRYIIDPNKNKLVENHLWPKNPQYLFSFEKNVQMKIILRKQNGHLSNEEAKIGLLITKPTVADSSNNTLISQSNKSMNQSMNKNDQMSRVIDITNKLLECKAFENEEITPKLSFNSSEWIVESTYSNSYSASLFMSLNRIDSPIIVIPTLDTPETPFEYELKIFSNHQGELVPLNTEESKILISEWKKDVSAAGSHLVQDEKKKEEEVGRHYSKKNITWYDNPKFLISFDSKEWITNLEFEVVVARSETIWRKKVANSIINSMMGVYIFKFDKEKWKDCCANMGKVSFMPKNEIRYKFQDAKADPKGYLIMPVTYGPDISGPFVLLVKCKEKFTLIPFEDKIIK